MQNPALWYRSLGLPEAVLSLESCEAAPREARLIRIRMACSPINPSDLIPMTGAYGHRVTPPRIAGYEGVGTVIEAQGVARDWIGRRVLPLRGAGTWQRYVDCDPSWAVPVPDDIEDTLAARAYVNPLAALLMTKRWNPAGKRVLVTAAGSSCSGLLAQWALAAGAREVVGVHRSPEHRIPLVRLGVDPVEAANVADVMAHSKKADLIFDAVGGMLATTILGAMREDAIFVSYGLLSGEAHTVCPHRPQPSRFHIRDHLEGLPPATWQRWFEEIWPRLKQSKLPGVTCFPLSDWRDALALFRRSGRQTKPLLSLG